MLLDQILHLIESSIRFQMHLIELVIYNSSYLLQCIPRGTYAPRGLRIRLLLPEKFSSFNADIKTSNANVFQQSIA